MIYRTITKTGRERGGQEYRLSLTTLHYFYGQPCLKLNVPGQANLYFSPAEVESMLNRYNRDRITREQSEIRGIDAIREYESAKRECFDVINGIVGEKVLKQ